MPQVAENLRFNRRVMAFTAAAMYGGAALDGLVTELLPGDPRFSLLPVVLAGIVPLVLVSVGARLPRRVLGLLGPVGIVLVAAAVESTGRGGDGAVMYAVPVLWTSFFFGTAGAVGIVTWVGICHGVLLLVTPGALGYSGRWVDVMVPAAAIAWAVIVLQRRNEALQRRLADEARTDPLTRVLNRRGLRERAEQEIAHWRREGGRMAIAGFDVDHFKSVNDRAGHAAGDRVLARVGAQLRAHCREGDIVARIGGDEFIVMLPGGDATAALALAMRVRRALQDEARAGGAQVRVSVGIYAADRPLELDALLHAADAALYEAKLRGRDRTVIGRAA